MALTERKKQILILAARGWTAKEIAQRLQVSPQTIKNNLGKSYDQMGARNLQHAVCLALLDQEISALDLIIDLPVLEKRKQNV